MNGPKTFPVQMETYEGDHLVETRETQMTILPPSNPNACSVCAVTHAAEEPHNAQSLYYQYAFYGEHMRWPTWKDAIAHCSAEMQAAWEMELRRAGHWSEPEEVPNG